MLTTFTLLVAAGIGFRLAISHMLKKRFHFHLVVPHTLAVLLIVLTMVPDFALAFAFPVPLSFVLGAILIDLVFRKGRA
jgi:asparagine N-glycosylation enzyme membrane subunit Stt3